MNCLIIDFNKDFSENPTDFLHLQANILNHKIFEETSSHIVMEYEIDKLNQIDEQNLDMNEHISSYHLS